MSTRQRFNPDVDRTLYGRVEDGKATMVVKGPEGFLQAYESSLNQFRDPSRALMSDVLLIHGACHGAWCWDDVASFLTESGHRPTAVDLPCDDPKSGLSEYADAAVASLPASADTI